ncbi:7,8-dihydro-6-hydroxymethylpterin-pyrophosphokinase [Sphingomonas sp. Leaf339]|uniref:2-amino-4-hydroxy-6- hydroxymethyldihydropteridine diphosphokinase n=1 Tax=Sphingomonas sp. Leaf339 TaxID=1736343 RepID=UPI0006FD30D1|nr:2-amino-4-hydroxy-6-hydroxymethyldihydropteridine diphosphokinase [Sphingomonas sp. Leaf339]KQU53250.1 7,8-dihydro-6-hydroxymethylpterin-pyrophosphokinase [Sphingomonas sp. Leaf339]
MATTLYAIALGANRYGHHGRPSAAIVAALAAIGDVEAVSPIIASAPIGPSTRIFANAAALIRSEESPPALLTRLKAIERLMGRRPGRRWGTRPIDLDIILWSGGTWRTRTLTIPHPTFRDRRFVLTPLARIAANWRDPISGLRVRHLLSQVDRRRPRT